MQQGAKIRSLLMAVPRPPEDAIPNGVSESDLREFTDRTDIPLPGSIRDWLKMSNGPCVGPGGIFGIRPARKGLDIERFIDIFPTWKTKKWIPVAGDGCGNYYVVPTQQEFGTACPVLFIDTSESSELPAYVVASDIEHFLVFLLEREMGKDGWPFNKNFVVHSDPAISEIRGVKLPWMA